MQETEYDGHSHIWAASSRYGDSLRAGRFGTRIPLGGEIFRVVQTRPEAHSASSTMGTGYFSGVKWPGRVTDHPPPSSAGMRMGWSCASASPLYLL
jgi:hypothetical protein